MAKGISAIRPGTQAGMSLKTIGLAGMAAQVSPDDCIKIADALSHLGSTVRRVKELESENQDLRQQLSDLKKQKEARRLDDWFWGSFGKLAMVAVAYLIYHYGFVV